MEYSFVYGLKRLNGWIYIISSELNMKSLDMSDRKVVQYG